jgi:hypothetical protein
MARNPNPQRKNEVTGLVFEGHGRATQAAATYSVLSSRAATSLSLLRFYQPLTQSANK